VNFRFHPAALAEHLDEVAFYESRVAGLGADYLAEFDAVMARICTAPDFYPCVADSNLRKARLKRFPFYVICRTEARLIIVVALAHQRRRPTYWVSRIKR
jgi:hypothetical protein